LRGNAIKPTDSVYRTIDETGGRLSLDSVSIEVAKDILTEDATLEVTAILERSLPVDLPKGVEMLGSAYAIEWDTKSRPSGVVPATITFEYDPDDLPKGASVQELAIVTFDGDEWMRIPSEVDPTTHTVSAEVTHFSLKALVRYAATSFWNREVADHTIADIHVTGSVAYEQGAFVGDPDARTVPAAGLRFALYDTDAIVLHEGVLDDNGGFDFVVPAGADVAIDLDVVLRVYADDPQVGTVLTQDGYIGVPWKFNSETLSYGITTNTIHFGKITASGSDSSFFNILGALEQGHRFTNRALSPITVIWPGMERDFPDRDSAYHPDDHVIALSRRPQTAWDDDLILRLYGEYAFHTELMKGQQLFCDGRRRGPNQLGDECSAWVEGWGYYFSSIIRGDKTYTLYENQSSSQINYNLETGDFPLGPRSAGAVMSLLWDLNDSSNDDEDAVVPLRVLGKIMRDYGAQIDSIASLYNFWSIEDSFDASVCEVFADYEIADPDDCAYAPPVAQEGSAAAPELLPSITPPQPAEPPPTTSTQTPTDAPTSTPTPEPTSTPNLSIPADAETVRVGYHPLSYNETVYGDVTGCCYQEGWYFAGRAGDIITLRFVPDFEEDLIIVRLSDPTMDTLDSNRGGEAVFEDIELPESGYYTIEIDVGFKEYGGTYTLSLEANNSPPDLPPPERQDVYLHFVPLGESGEVGFREGIGFPLTRERWITSIEGEAGQILNFTASGGGDLDPILRLLDEDGNLLTEDDDSLGDGGAWIRDYALPYTGLFLVELQFYAGTEGHVALALETEGFEPVAPTDTPQPPAPETTEEPTPTAEVSDTCDRDCAIRCRDTYNSTGGYCDDDGVCICHCSDSQCKSICQGRGYDNSGCYAGRCECFFGDSGGW